MDRERASSEEFKIVGTSGQISLGKRFVGKRLRVDYRPDGSILLAPVVMVPESEIWTVREPHLSRINRGLAWAAGNPPSESNLEEMEKSALREGKKRGSRK